MAAAVSTTESLTPHGGSAALSSAFGQRAASFAVVVMLCPTVLGMLWPLHLHGTRRQVMSLLVYLDANDRLYSSLATG